MGTIDQSISEHDVKKISIWRKFFYIFIKIKIKKKSIIATPIRKPLRDLPSYSQRMGRNRNAEKLQFSLMKESTPTFGLDIT